MSTFFVPFHNSKQLPVCVNDDGGGECGKDGRVNGNHLHPLPPFPLWNGRVVAGTSLGERWG